VGRHHNFAKLSEIKGYEVFRVDRHLSYLEALLGAEVEDRYQHGVARRITEAHSPKVKTLEDFAFSDAPHLPAAQIRNLAEGGYMSRASRLFFLEKPERVRPTWRRG
jgi:DNA replication protein DnaC